MPARRWRRPVRTPERHRPWKLSPARRWPRWALSPQRLARTAGVLDGSGEFGGLAVTLLGLAVPSELPAEGDAVVEGDDGASVAPNVAGGVGARQGRQVELCGRLRGSADGRAGRGPIGGDRGADGRSVEHDGGCEGLDEDRRRLRRTRRDAGSSAVRCAVVGIGLIGAPAIIGGVGSGRCCHGRRGCVGLADRGEQDACRRSRKAVALAPADGSGCGAILLLALGTGGGGSGTGLELAAMTAAFVGSELRPDVVFASDVLPFLAVAPDLLLGPVPVPVPVPAPVLSPDIGAGGGLSPVADAAGSVELPVVEPPDWVLSVLAVLSAGAFACWSAGAGGGLLDGGLLGDWPFCGGVGVPGAFVVASSKASNGDSLLLCVFVDVCQRCAEASALVALIS